MGMPSLPLLNGEIDREALLPYPSILFGMETALLHFRARSLQFWHTPFSKGKEGIPINGLIWMGNFDEMYRRIGRRESTVGIYTQFDLG